MWQFASNLVVAMIVAVLTVQLSLRRFYREKWWERRLDAYIRVIEALHHMMRDLDASYKREIEGRDHESAHAKELSAKASAGWAEVRKTIDMGQLLLSPEALNVLRHMMEDRLRPDHMYFEYLDHTLAEVRECLPKVIALAKIDLKLTPSSFDRWTKKLTGSKRGLDPTSTIQPPTEG